MLLNIGLKGPPCGTPCSVSSNLWPIITPARKYLFYPADGIRTVLAVQQTFNYFLLVASQIREQLLHIHLVNAATPLVRLNLFIGSVKVLALASDRRSSGRESRCTQASCLTLVALLRGRLQPSQSKSALPHSLRVPRYPFEGSFLLFSTFLPSSGNLKS